MGNNSPLINSLRPYYEATLAVIYGDRGIPWSINNVPFRIDPRSRQLMGKNWDSEVAEFLRKRVKPGSTCIDVGANAGVYVLQFSHWSAPQGRIIAFEPNPITREILRTHIRMNGLQERVEISTAAVSDAEGEAEFHFVDASGMSRLGRPNPMLGSRAQTVTLKTTTLDLFCGRRELRPDWILMDIEGYELHALRGARALLARCPALQVVVEMHPSLWPSAGTTSSQWRDFFVDAQLRPVPLMGQDEPLQETGSVYLERC